MRARACDDAGTTVIEFALVALLLITLTLGAVDFGLWMFQKSEASQAAREATRVAMLRPPTIPGAQPSGSTIYNAAAAELQGGLSGFAVAAYCYDPSTWIQHDACTPAADVVTVTVSWHRDALTPVGVTADVSGSSSRTVVGTPGSSP